jgi:hypothetical protein
MGATDEGGGGGGAGGGGAGGGGAEPGGTKANERTAAVASATPWHVGPSITRSPPRITSRTRQSVGEACETTASATTGSFTVPTPRNAAARTSSADGQPAGAVHVNRNDSSALATSLQSSAAIVSAIAIRTRRILINARARWDESRGFEHPEHVPVAQLPDNAIMP